MKLASTHVLVAGLLTVLSAGICGVSAQTLQLEPAERVPHPVVDPASEEAQLAIQRFSVPRGLQVKLKPDDAASALDAKVAELI